MSAAKRINNSLDKKGFPNPSEKLTVRKNNYSNTHENK